MANLNEQPLSTEKALLQRLHKAQAEVQALTNQVAHLQEELNNLAHKYYALREATTDLTQGFKTAYKLTRL